jgi:hypothetical protein
VDGLAAGSAGLAGGVVEVGDGDGSDADGWAVEAHGGGDGVLFGAGGEAVGGVFYVAAGDDGVGIVVEQKGCADSEVAVGGVGVVGGFGGAVEEVGDLGGGEAVGWRHESEATWAGGRRQVGERCVGKGRTSNGNGLWLGRGWGREAGFSAAPLTMRL